MRKTDLAVLYACYGAGHIQTLNALKQGAEIVGQNINIDAIDLGKLADSFVYDLTQKLYNKMPLYFRPIFAASYYLTKNLPMGSKLKESYTGTGIDKMRDAILKMNPRAIVSVYPLTTAMCAVMKRKGEIKVPVCAVVTDADVHSGWLFKEIDRYFVMDEETKRGITEYGVEKDRIFVTGIPIRKQFTENYDRKKVREQFGMDPELPAVLVSAGGMGVKSIMYKMADWVDEAGISLQIIVLTGANEEAYNYMKNFAKSSKNKVIVPGMVENMAALMQACDVIFTKSGGLTMSESLASGLPMVLYGMIPGQEMANMRFLTREGAAIKLKSKKHLGETLQTILRERECMSAACKRISKPNAAEDCMRYILDLMR